MNNSQNTSPEKVEENQNDGSLQSSSYECKNLAEGSVTQTLEVEGWISRGWNCFRPADQWRAAVRIGDHMEWQWCESEEQAIAWVQGRLPRGYIPNSMKTIEGNIAIGTPRAEILNRVKSQLNEEGARKYMQALYEIVDSRMPQHPEIGGALDFLDYHEVTSILLTADTETQELALKKANLI